MEVALWAEAAELPDARLAAGTVFAIKGLRVTPNKGLSGHVYRPSQMHFDLELPAARDLDTWWVHSTDKSLRNLSDGELTGSTPLETKTGSLADLPALGDKLQGGQKIAFNCKA